MSTKSYFVQLGTNWNNGLKASLYWNLNNSVGNRNRNIGAQLVTWNVNGKKSRLSHKLRCITRTSW